jgi:BirA family biotin operon repressor/biotin-[acetyl-CoA-carboxylase] ligase
MIIKNFNYKCVNSTNDIAINLIKKKNIRAGLVLAEKQKKGRGQRKKKWISYKGNLFVSIFFSLDKINLTLKQLTKFNANLVIRLISQYYKKKN